MDLSTARGGPAAALLLRDRLAVWLALAAGIMSPLWTAAITVFVFVEKLFPGGQWIARISGVAMLGFGIYLICQA